jgi:hypothetical protein
MANHPQNPNSISTETRIDLINSSNFAQIPPIIPEGALRADEIPHPQSEATQQLPTSPDATPSKLRYSEETVLTYNHKDGTAVKMTKSEAMKEFMARALDGSTLSNNEASEEKKGWPACPYLVSLALKGPEALDRGIDREIRYQEKVARKAASANDVSNNVPKLPSKPAQIMAGATRLPLNPKGAIEKISDRDTVINQRASELFVTRGPIVALHLVEDVQVKPLVEEPPRIVRDIASQSERVEVPFLNSEPSSEVTIGNHVQLNQPFDHPTQPSVPQEILTPAVSEQAPLSLMPDVQRTILAVGAALDTDQSEPISFIVDPMNQNNQQTTAFSLEFTPAEYPNTELDEISSSIDEPSTESENKINETSDAQAYPVSLPPAVTEGYFQQDVARELVPTEIADEITSFAVKDIQTLLDEALSSITDADSEAIVEEAHVDFEVFMLAVTAEMSNVIQIYAKNQPELSDAANEGLVDTFVQLLNQLGLAENDTLIKAFIDILHEAQISAIQEMASSQLCLSDDLHETKHGLGAVVSSLNQKMIDLSAELARMILAAA